GTGGRSRQPGKERVSLADEPRVTHTTERHHRLRPAARARGPGRDPTRERRSHSEGRHLLGLINEVLDVARIEAGNLAMSPEPVSADEVLRAALALIRPQAAARSVQILEPAPVGRYVTADRQRLQQVLLNLLSNAVKYNRQGGAVRVGCEDGSSGDCASRW